MTRFVPFIAAALAFAPASRLWACATCFGDPADPQTHGMNAAILTLLGVTYGLFTAMGVVGFLLWRRSRLAAVTDATAHAGARESQHV